MFEIHVEFTHSEKLDQSRRRFLHERVAAYSKRFCEGVKNQGFNLEALAALAITYRNGVNDPELLPLYNAEILSVVRSCNLKISSEEYERLENLLSGG